MVSVKINFKKKDLWLLSAIVVFLVGAGFVVAFGGNNPAVMGHDAGELTGVCKTDGTGCPATSQTPYYRIKYLTASNKYVISDFASPNAVYNFISPGEVTWTNNMPIGSYLLEMKINAISPITKQIYVRAVDNRLEIFLDGNSIYGPVNVVEPNLNVNVNLSPGEHIIQIIYNSQGSADYLYLWSNIIDNTNVKFVGF